MSSLFGLIVFSEAFQIRCELARKFNDYTNLTGLKKAHVMRILLERFLAARNKKEKSINISLG